MQIAGFVARRIVTFSQEGDSVGVGQRFGLIRFGSRVDTFCRRAMVRSSPSDSAPLRRNGAR